MGNSQAALLDRTAVLMSKNDGERSYILADLSMVLNSSDPQANKTRSQALLDSKAVMDVLLRLSATTRAADVAENALGVLAQVARDGDNTKRLLREHPGLVLVAMRKLDFRAENATEGVQIGALCVLQNLAVHVDNARKMAAKNPRLVPLLVAKVEFKLEQVQIGALGVLQCLAFNAADKRGMVIQNPTLVPLLVAKVESYSEQVQVGALGVLNRLAFNSDNAQEMLANHAKLVPLLLARIGVLHAIMVVYGLSCSPANRALLRRNKSVVAALTKGREDKNMATRFFSLLILVNLFGAEGDLFKTDLTILQLMFELITHAMNKDGWDLNQPLLAFRYLCVVEHNRQLLWNEFGGEFMSRVLAALQQAIDDKDVPAVENAVSILAQFSSDAAPLVWMRRHKPRLDKVIDQLALFPDALKTAQFLLLVVAPPVDAILVQFVPQNEEETRQWLSKHEHGEDIADRLVREGLGNAKALGMLSKKSWGELKAVLELNAMQALTLETALKELF